MGNEANTFYTTRDRKVTHKCAKKGQERQRHINPTPVEQPVWVEGIIPEIARWVLPALRCKKKPCGLTCNQTISKRTKVSELNIHCLVRKSKEAVWDRRSWPEPSCRPLISRQLRAGSGTHTDLSLGLGSPPTSSHTQEPCRRSSSPAFLPVVIHQPRPPQQDQKISQLPGRGHEPAEWCLQGLSTAPQGNVCVQCSTQPSVGPGGC